jgi:hypothetical protein
MKHKRVISVLMAISLVILANISMKKSYDATKVKMVNSDLIWLTISSVKKDNSFLDQTCSHNSGCE